jgi:WD40 repeat protein
LCLVLLTAAARAQAPALPPGDKEPFLRLEAGGPTTFVTSLAFSPDGSMLAGAVTDDNLWLWDVTNARSPTALATLTGTTHSLFTVAFSPSGSTLAASGADSVVRFWQPDAIQARDSQCAGIGEPLTPADWARYAPGLPFTAPCA